MPHTKKGHGHDPFTKMYDVTVAKLLEAGVGSKEFGVYAVLTRCSDMKAGCMISVPAADIARKTGISENYVNACVRRMREKRFTWGTWKVPVLTRVSKACKGHTAVYRDNITLYRLHPYSSPPKDITRDEASAVTLTDQHTRAKNLEATQYEEDLELLDNPKPRTPRIRQQPQEPPTECEYTREQLEQRNELFRKWSGARLDEALTA